MAVCAGSALNGSYQTCLTQQPQSVPLLRQLPLAITNLGTLPPIDRVRHELQVEQLVVQFRADGAWNDVIHSCQFASVGAFGDRWSIASAELLEALWSQAS